VFLSGVVLSPCWGVGAAAAAARAGRTLSVNAASRRFIGRPALPGRCAMAGARLALARTSLTRCLSALSVIKQSQPQQQQQ